jgi:hypothetical protein
MIIPLTLETVFQLHDTTCRREKGCEVMEEEGGAPQQRRTREKLTLNGRAVLS